MKMSDILTAEEIRLIKQICRVFNGQWVEVNGVRYSAPPQEKG